MSKKQVTGKIEKAYTNDRGISSILVDGTWYGTYKKSYKDIEGSTVTFEAEQKGKYWNAGPVEVSKEQPPAAASRSAPATDNRQQSIVLQSSYKLASDVLGLMITAGAVTLPKTKAEQYDAILGYLDELALRFYNNCIDPSSFLEAVDAQPPGPESDGPDGYKHLEA